jgi:hypothetical protein
VVLELLERLERREVGVRVIQADNEADIHAVVVQVIQERTTIDGGGQRPANRVLDQPRRRAPGGKLP